MPRSLSQLPRTNFSGLDYTNIIQDITNLVMDNPDYNDNWDDFLSSNAGRMLIELFAYIGDQLATRIDWVANENWIGTATQKRSIMRLLKLIGYNLTLPTASEVAVRIDLTGSTFPGAFFLTDEYDPAIGTLTPFSLQAKDKKGVLRKYELITYDSTTKKYEYKMGDTIGDSLVTKNFYEGTTYVETFEIENDNSEVLTLTNYPVIQDSVRVYFVDSTVSPRTETEALLVDTFLDTNAQRSVDDDGNDLAVPYIINVLENESVEVEFGSKGLLPAANRRPAIGDTYKVFYRSGGGLDGNLTARSINTTKTLSITTIAGASATIQPSFLNSSEGTGGADGETAERAATYGPLQIRTADKAVTPDDYDILLTAKQGTITAKAYGSNNAPSDVFSSYGVYINPLDVWCYVVPQRSGWESVNASDYNSFWWMTLNLQNMFNEVISFTTAYFNKQVEATNNSFQGTSLTGDTIDYDGAHSTETFKNYIILPVGDTIGDSIYGNAHFALKVGDSLDTTHKFSSVSNLVVGDSIRTATGDTALQITENIYAYYQSSVNIEAGVNLIEKKWLKINIDAQGDTWIDLTTEAGDTTNVRPIEIMKAINKKLYTSSVYDNSGTPQYGDSQGATGVASLVEPNVSQSFIKLTSPISGSSSSIKFLYAGIGDSNAIATVLGSQVDGDTYMCYGTRRLTLVTNSALTNYVNKLIYETGTLTLGDSTSGDTFLIHAILSSGDTTAIGTYFNTNYTNGTDVEYRDIADRVYSNINKTGDSVPDVYTSDFDMRFTMNSTDSMSLYTITNSWDISYASNPTIIGDTRANTGDTFLGLGSTKFQMRINIDGKGDTTIDVTGDSGQSSSYSGQHIASKINTALQNTYTSVGYPYSTYNYVVYDAVSKHLTFKSPTRENDSRIVLTPTGGDTDARDVLFGIALGTTKTYYATGDYYLDYNASADRMDIVRLTSNNQSSMPDGNIYAHYIWDRRGDSTTTDEDSYESYMENKKLIGLNNVYKQTKFTTFDITGIVYYDNSFSSGVVKSAVEEAVKEEYSFVNTSGAVKRDYDQDVSKSQILSIIQGIDGVEYVEISFFGKDVNDSSTNEANIIECRFDEILVLCESSSGKGISFTYIGIEAS